MILTFLRTNNNKANHDPWSNCNPYWSYTYEFTWKSQSGLIHLDLSDHDIICCTVKTSLPKSPKHNDEYVRSTKKSFKKSKTDYFPKYLTYTCLNHAYSYFIYRSEEAINFIAPAKRIRLIRFKANSKASFNN